ncbi:adenosine kinase [Pikeienuella piscinae]|uniref:Adenosine kinase n=1 Tax=Pikeienuella piscinae TaxID=2748098 RepID=A0A7L5BX87_9RHOB|nr:adenosine kinase [Pikeienuella piscinae]QIE55763.1 adenosine kinase [Pikeienuella piscinae]
MKTYDVVGVGNALVDILSHCEDAFLAEHKIEKGIMTLIDAARAVELYGAMGPAQEVSGGSAANTIAGLAMLGARTAYVGKVKDDQLGSIFAHDIRAIGATYETPRAPASDEHETGRCMVLVSPDGERSMSTYLGVSETLGPDDIDPAMMAEAAWIYLEGYRFDGAASVAAFEKAIGAAKSAGGRVSITLSDPFCVDRHREAFRALIADHTDLLFANEHELMSLYETDDLDVAMQRVKADVDIAAVTVGAKGAHVVTPAESVHVPTAAMSVVDATGAGDLFAAGFLAGLAQGRELAHCAAMGCVAAGEVIGHIGARPEADLGQLMKERKLWAR